MPPGRQPFKPPRPVGSSASTSSVSVPKPNVSKQDASMISIGASSKKRAPIESTSSEDEESQLSKSVDPIAAYSSSQAFETMPDRNATSTGPSADVAPALQVIPPQLLSKLVHNHFQHDDTRITKEAMAVLAKYIETFVKEAIYRANHERNQQEGGDGFLEVRMVGRAG